MRQKNFGKGSRPSPPRATARPAHRPGQKPAEKREKHGAERRAPDQKGTGSQWLYGLHAVQAALANPRRRLGRAALTPRAADTLGEKLLKRVEAEIMEPGAVDKLLPPGAVH